MLLKHFQMAMNSKTFNSPQIILRALLVVYVNKSNSLAVPMLTKRSSTSFLELSMKVGIKVCKIFKLNE